MWEVERDREMGGRKRMRKETERGRERCPR